MSRFSVLESRIPHVASRNNGDINTDPRAFWQLIKPEEYLGSFVADGLTWKKIFPGRQYVPEGKGSHFMITPYATDRYITPTSLTAKQFAPTCDIALSFLNEEPKKTDETKFVAYVIGEDKSRKTPQSWHNLHIHFVSYDNSALQETDIANPRRQGLTEPYQETTQHLLQEWFSKDNILSSSAQKINIPQHSYPSNDIRIQLPNSMKGEQLATLLQGLDSSYQRLHKTIFSCFVNNYDEAVASKGQISFKLRSKEDVMQQILNVSTQFPKNRDRVLQLAQIRDVLKEKMDVDSMHQFITPHSYALMITPLQNQNTLIFAPRFLTTMGFLEPTGVLSRRIDVDPSQAPIQQRFESARREAGRLSP